MFVHRVCSLNTPRVSNEQCKPGNIVNSKMECGIHGGFAKARDARLTRMNNSTRLRLDVLPRIVEVERETRVSRFHPATMTKTAHRCKRLNEEATAERPEIG